MLFCGSTHILLFLPFWNFVDSMSPIDVDVSKSYHITCLVFAFYLLSIVVLFLFC